MIRSCAMVGFLGIFVMAGCSCSSSGTVPAVAKAREYVVEFATATGEIISEKAASLREAIVRAWHRVFPNWEGNIQVDPGDPLRGILRGEYRYTVVIREPDGRETKLDFIFHDPAMRRVSIDDPWALDSSIYKGLLSSPGQHAETTP